MKVRIRVKLADKLREALKTGLRYVPAGPGQPIPKRPAEERKADPVTKLLDKLGVGRV